jgi:hypothetical protein
LGILESSNVRWLWITLGGVLAILGVAVQLVGALASSRDYLDVAGRGITLSRQIDYLLHGGFDSFFVNLSPQGSPIQINPFGIVLALFVGVLGVWIIRRWRQPATEIQSSSRIGVAVLAAALIVEFSAFVLFVVAPYPQVLAARGNTKYVSGNSFLAAGRTCEASAMFSLAIEQGTTFQSDAVAKLGDLLPRAQGTPIGASKLLEDEEKSDGAVIEEDGTVTITGEGSLMADAAGQGDVIARGHASPVPVTADAAYEVSGWIRTENVYGEGFGTVSVAEDDGAFHNIHNTDIIDLSETNGWRFFRKTWTTQPTTRRLFIAAGLWKSYGTVWIDGLVLSQITSDNPPSRPQTACQ